MQGYKFFLRGGVRVYKEPSQGARIFSVWGRISVGETGTERNGEALISFPLQLKELFQMKKKNQFLVNSGESGDT